LRLGGSLRAQGTERGALPATHGERHKRQQYGHERAVAIEADEGLWPVD